MLAPQATTRPRQPPKMIFICKLRLFELRGPQAQISALHLLRINAVCKTARAVASPRRRLAALTPQATTRPRQPPKMIIRPINAILQDCAACGGPPWAFLRRLRPTKHRRAPLQPYSEKPSPYSIRA